MSASSASMGLIPAWAGKTPRAPPTPSPEWAHPRVGGENENGDKESTSGTGSSPRGRGKPAPPRRSHARGRLIPAWAGKTPGGTTSRTSRTAHPRVGGENGTRRLVHERREGSSPRGRGKLALWRHVQEHGRLIPAWAGKTSWRSAPRPSTAAHPRVGGENQGSASRVLGVQGSSPRGRGKRQAGRREAHADRLIPAWAGKTCDWRPSTPGTWAHPRVGGENVVAVISASGVAGSSPRGRGKRLDALEASLSEGLIPAWAGKTSSCAACPPSPRAHPRVGGENPPRQKPASNGRGSSPRGRGKPENAVVPVFKMGLIPAWAGKTRGVGFRRRFGAAHPRVGGENLDGVSCWVGDSGSSPRGRGKPSSGTGAPPT